MGSLGAPGQLECFVACPDEDEPLCQVPPRAVGLPGAGVVAAEHEAVHDRACLFGRADVESFVEQPRNGAAEAEAGDAGGRVADRIAVQLVAAAAAGGDDPSLLAVEDARRAGLALHLAGLDQTRKPGVEGGHLADRVEDGEGGEVRIGGLRRGGDLHRRRDAIRIRCGACATRSTGGR